MPASTPSSASAAASLEFLNARRDWVLGAPKNDAPIITLCARPGVEERVFVERLQLDPEQGVVGDRWTSAAWIRLPDGRPDPRIQVCLLGARVLQLVRRDGGNLVHPGDTIIADMDFSEENLPVGQRLQAGTALLEVSDVFNTACSKWQRRYGEDALRWINLPENLPHRLRGIFAQVVQGGEVSLLDSLHKV